VVSVLKKNKVDLLSLVAIRYELLKDDGQMDLQKFKTLLKQSRIILSNEDQDCLIAYAKAK